MIWGLLRHHINCLLPPFSVCQKSATTVARSSNKKSLSKQILVVHGASRLKKMLQDSYLVKL